MDKDIKIDTPVAKDMIRRKSPSPKRSRRSSRENNGTDTESVNGVREVEPNLGANLRNNVVGKGDVHIPGLGRIKEVLFIPEIPYNVLAIIKLIKGTKIKVLFNNGTIQLTNDGKEVGDVIVTIIANFSNDGVKNGKEEGGEDDNADSDTSDEEIEGESTDEYSSDDSSAKNIPTENIPRRSLRTNKGKIPNTLEDYVMSIDTTI
ncbi:hypothetical protein E2320_002153, partial [Naja naja]